MFIALMAYIPSAGWPTLGHDSQRSSYQSVSGAEISAPSVKWRVPVTQILQRSCGPVLSDVRADYPGCEVLFNDGKYLKCLDGNTGNQIWSFALPDTDYLPNSTPAVGDVDGDGIPEMVACKQMPGILFCLNAQTGALEWLDTVSNGQQIMAPVCLTDVSGTACPRS
ncbi:MAG: hypothetical protein ABIM74_05230 [candidate division WOR-3 bacterium]